MKFLVTGATGLLGNNVVRQLIHDGRSVRVLARGPLPRHELAGLDIDVVEGDVLSAEAVARACAGVDCVIHSAGDLHIGWRPWTRQRRVNVEGTAMVADAARRENARLIHVSTVDALPAATRHGSPVDEETPDRCKLPCTYVVTKREADQEVMRRVENGLDALIVHPGFMLGPWDWKPSSGRMLLSIAQHWIPAAPSGGMSGCDVRDVTHAILVAVDRGVTGRRYILAGHNQSFLEAWQLFARVTKRPGPSFRMGPLVRWVAGGYGDLKSKLSGVETDVNSATIRMSGMLNYYSSARAQAELDYQIRPFDQSVADAWAWFVEHGYAPSSA